jgi:hypothetical protein
LSPLKAVGCVAVLFACGVVHGDLEPAELVATLAIAMVMFWSGYAYGRRDGSLRTSVIPGREEAL